LAEKRKIVVATKIRKGTSFEICENFCGISVE